MTRILMAAALSVLCLTTSAQKFKIGVGPILSFPVGNLGSDYTVGIGAEGTAVYKFNKNFEAFGEFGLHHFFERNDKGASGYGLTSPAIDAIPILVGARYVSGNLFAGLGVGYHTFGSGDGPAISPQVGYRLRKVDIIFHYTGAQVYEENLGYFGFKAYYYFFSK